MNNQLHEQLQISLELQLDRLRNERTALDAKINDVETQLGIQNDDDKTPTPAQQFQAERDAKPSPFKD